MTVRPPQTVATMTPKPPDLMTRAQGTIIILLLLVTLGFPAFSFLKPINRWEYQTLEFTGTGMSRTGSGALGASTILVESSKLREMGAQGWELVGTLLEMETAFPNFGKDEYTTGLRENVRPQKAVLIFKRRTRWF